MTPEPHFIPYLKPTLQALTLQTYSFAPLTRWRRDIQKGVYSQCQLLKIMYSDDY